MAALYCFFISISSNSFYGFVFVALKMAVYLKYSTFGITLVLARAISSTPAREAFQT